ncbi:TRAP transporter small permease [Pelagibacterium montanilacus]|uniref:TRAP transporter small permease n=1 Tax=Pelagibacterium montanilacus TaxID=2185280 RepID=UPI0013DF020F|nr:TRAP transporter small permease [Pelagibacterium montanilacus]
MKALGRAFDTILNVLAVIAGVILVSMMLMTVTKVGMRVVMNHGIRGVDQISGTMMVYMTFLGAAWVLRKEAHVTVDLIVAVVPDKVRRIMHVTSSLIGAAACFAVTWFGTNAVLLSLSRQVVVAAELEIPRAINLVVIPLGCLLLGIEFLRRAIRFYRGDVPATKPSEI